MTALDGREVGVSVVWAWFEDEYTRHVLKRLETPISDSCAAGLRYSCGCGKLDDTLSGR